MSLLSSLLHLDQTLGIFIKNYGTSVYLLLVLIIFCETGLVVLPFLPGDSLLFAVGAFCSSGHLALWVCLLLLGFAAILGDALNYWIGRWSLSTKLGKKFLSLLNPKHIQTTHEFYKKYGGVTIILARFVPIVRTFAPFVAGTSHMPYRQFLLYNVLGGAIWVASLTILGFLFGHLPIVKNNFSAMVLGIVGLSVVPILIGFVRRQIRERARRKKLKPEH